MEDAQRDVCIDLAAERHLTLDDARGTPLEVTRGTVWITQEKSYDDVILHTGDHWTVERPGRTVIQAQGDASLCIAMAPGTWRDVMLRQFAHWLVSATALRRRAVHGWLSLRTQRTLPYY